jgi:phytoene dehydrogenase-like protein
MSGPEDFDLVVVGGGMGGLATAALASRQGLRVALLEAHTNLGGCAGYFGRGPYPFAVGPTALMGLKPSEPSGELLPRLGVDFRAATTPIDRVHLPDRTLDIGPDSRAFEAASARAFPGKDVARRLFWRLQEAVGAKLFRLASGRPSTPDP